MRDLCRAREDAKEDLLRCRHRLSKMLLRRGLVYRGGKKAWSREVDEIWAFVQKKNKNVIEADDWIQVGDQYTFVAIDPETKLIPSYKVGKRTAYTTLEFIDDLASRLRNRVQISSDAFLPYVHAIEQSFGRDVDYATVVKEFVETPAGRGRYSPGRMMRTEKAHRADAFRLS